MIERKIDDIIKEEVKITEETMDKLARNRNRIIENKIKQDKYKQKIYVKVLLCAAVPMVLLLLFLNDSKISSAISKALGISQDSAVTTLENNNISNEINLTSIQNEKKITLTKFVSTESKFGFDYQFKIDNDYLKKLLEKEISANSNQQFIEYGLFSKENNEDLIGGAFTSSTFRVEGNVFYGSVMSSLTGKKIPNNTNLSLHIYKLWWQDRAEFEKAKSKALEDPEQKPFGVDTALEYIGDWKFDIPNKPINQTSIPKVVNKNNIGNISVKSDALQTTAEFNTTLSTNESIGIDIYKNGVKDKNELSAEVYDLETGDITVSFNLSSLDKNSVYKIQVNRVDEQTGEANKEIGFVEFKNE
ncbi:hypothetical protein [Enterococcus sp. AZ126]|uniref:hypothetical protein n=1 Tax=Enterococcus sp. AZ126 TaxID=2774635 RepID=UPI003F1ECB5D